MPFIYQILDGLAGRGWYYFLDGYLGYNKISIALEDQEKITFTCPYGDLCFQEDAFRVMQYLIHLLAVYNVDLL